MKIKFGLKRLTVSEIARFSDGKLVASQEHSEFSPSYICTDSRESDENTVFVAIRGERVDGHDYIKNVVENGCRCIICEKIPVGIDENRAAFVVVEDSVNSLGRFARAYREEKRLPILAITGSYGKTTTKELASKILSQKHKCYSTKGNFNSVIGMPMSLLEAEEECENAVFEMGMSGFGEISSMSRTALPEVAIVANIGTSHLEYLKTRENIAKAKLEIADGLREGGYLLLNGDEPLLRKFNPTENNYKILYFGVRNKQNCDGYAENIRVGDTYTEFDLVFGGRCYKALKINLVGEHFAYNAGLAAIGSILLGAGEEEIREGLISYRPEGFRNKIESFDGITMLADCYNAAPESMKAAIDTLSSLKIEGKRIAVLGDMKELGTDSKRLHYELGKYISGRLDVLYCVGELALEIARGAIEDGMIEEKVFCQTDGEDISALSSKIKSKISSGDAILIKASRGMKFERFIEGLKKQSN